MSSRRNIERRDGGQGDGKSAAGRHEVALKMPRAAALAGILFSVLLLTALVLLLLRAGIRTADPARWLDADVRQVAVAINLVPFAGIAFLWFVGVLRDRLGPQEDKLFATVFLGSGLLFVGLLFIAAAAIGALTAFYSGGAPMAGTAPAIRLVRHFAYNIAGIYALKMAAVFMLTASTLILRTGFTARWTAIAGYIAALFVLFASQALDWTVFVFPLWVLLVSVSILFDASEGTVVKKED